MRFGFWLWDWGRKPNSKPQDFGLRPPSDSRNPTSLWLIVGLGNPGTENAATYHNAGFRIVERIAREQRTTISEQCGPTLISQQIVVGGQPAVLILPQSYMNRTGPALLPVFERFECGIQRAIVAYDDLALPLGKIRVRQKGSAGGHNGIKSIISAFDSEEFMRVRVGIQPDREIGNVRDFVLSRVAADDSELLSKSEEIAARAVESLISDGIEKAMAAYNGVDLREKKDN